MVARARAGVAQARARPPSYILQTPAARSREVIHCIRLRREEATRDSTGRRSDSARETQKTSTASHINCR